MTSINGAARPHYGQNSQHATGGKKGSTKGHGPKPVDGWAQAHGKAAGDGAADGADLVGKKPGRGHHHTPGDCGGKAGSHCGNPDNQRGHDAGK